MARRYSMAKVRKLWQPSANVVVKVQIAVCREQIDECRQNGLGDRSNPIEGLRTIRNAELQARHSIAALQNRLPLPQDGNDGAWPIGPVPLAKQRVNEIAHPGA